MKEHPILFNAEMVKAILAGAKTQTRRVIGIRNTIKSEDISQNFNARIVQATNYQSSNLWTFGLRFGEREHYESVNIYCPYGQVGDRLWCRETWAKSEVMDYIYYKADGGGLPKNLKYKPSIHMFRWMSRITLEITEVRVERVQEISPEDCLREGLSLNYSAVGALPLKFHRLWDSLNAKRGYGWVVNPWVWVISFRINE